MGSPNFLDRNLPHLIPGADCLVRIRPAGALGTAATFNLSDLSLLVCQVAASDLMFSADRFTERARGEAKGGVCFPHTVK